MHAPHAPLRSTDAVLEVSNLRVAYNTPEGATKTVVNDVSLTLQAGELVCVLGPSGCGKTSLLNAICGLIPSTGAIACRRDARPDSRPDSRSKKESNRRGGAERRAQNLRIGYLFQQDALFPWRTVRDNLLLVAEMTRRPQKEVEARFLNYLEIFRLSREHLDYYPDQLSGGMRQRVALIQALLLDPELLLLDEPFSSLDYYTKLRLESEFQQTIKTEGKAAILVTHDIEEAIAMGDRVLIMGVSGIFIREYQIELNGGAHSHCDSRSHSAETARGLPEFAEYHAQIWNDLKMVIGNE
jgi:NitT/TauT family transport system ATP-binding protein